MKRHQASIGIAAFFNPANAIGKQVGNDTAPGAVNSLYLSGVKSNISTCSSKIDTGSFNTASVNRSSGTGHVIIKINQITRCSFGDPPDSGSHLRQILISEIDDRSSFGRSNPVHHGSPFITIIQHNTHKKLIARRKPGITAWFYHKPPCVFSVCICGKLTIFAGISKIGRSGSQETAIGIHKNGVARAIACRGISSNYNLIEIAVGGIGV